MPAHLLLEPPVVTAQASAVHALAASPWAPLLAVTSQRQVLLHHAGTLELIGILPFPEGDPVSLAFTPDARYLIVGGGIPGKSGVTVTFDVTTRRRLLSAGKEFDSILAADIRPGFDIVATGGPSRLLKLWNTESGALIKSIKKHTDWITALDLSPDGVLLASGDRNGGVYVWESETANEFHTLRAHQAAITAAVFRADSNILATASEDGTVRFWEMNGGSEVKKIDAHPGGVTAFSFARDGSSLTAGRDSKVKLWKPDFNPCPRLAQYLPALPTSAALDAEGKRAFIGDARGMVLVFNTADGKPLGEIPTNPPAIEARLQTITTQITTQEQTIAAASNLLDSRTAERDKARQALSEAEKTHHQAVEIHKAAQAGAVQTPDEATQKTRARSRRPQSRPPRKLPKTNAPSSQRRKKPSPKPPQPAMPPAPRSPHSKTPKNAGPPPRSTPAFSQPAASPKPRSPPPAIPILLHPGRSKSHPTSRKPESKTQRARSPRRPRRHRQLGRPKPAPNSPPPSPPSTWPSPANSQTTRPPKPIGHTRPFHRPLRPARPREKARSRIPPTSLSQSAGVIPAPVPFTGDSEITENGVGFVGKFRFLVSVD